MNRKLFTIGYTGFSLDTFVEVLKTSGVECLIDAREIPISRKRGFSKSAIQTALATAGIDYTHLRQLGSPKADRHRLRADGDYSRFFLRVTKHLESPAATEQIHAAAEIGKTKRACLMCCCPDWTHCHRRCLVELMYRDFGFTFEHLATTTATVARSRRAA